MIRFFRSLRKRLLTESRVGQYPLNTIGEIALVVICILHGSGLSAAPLFVDNHGFVLGELNRVDLIGINRQLVGGEVSIGNNGPGEDDDIGDELQHDYVLNNPWDFCGEQKFYGTLVDHMGEFVVIEYRTPKKSSLLQCPSTNEIVAVYPVSRGNPAGQVLESTKISMPGKPYGVSVGRIVNAQESDKYNKNWSVVMQLGNSGNDFLHMQIVDADLYAFALECLNSATKVKIYHVELINRGSDPDRSQTFVWKIETKPGNL